MVQSHNVIGIKLHQSDLLQIRNFQHIDSELLYSEHSDDDLTNYRLDDVLDLHPETYIFRAITDRDGVLNAFYYFGVEVNPINPSIDEISDAINVAVSNLPQLRQLTGKLFLTYDSYIVYPHLNFEDFDLEQRFEDD